MNLLLSDLIQGHLSDIRLGMSPADVQRLLGPPETMSEEKRPASVWKYGDLELSFSASNLFLLAIYFSRRSLRLPSAIRARGQDLGTFSLAQMRSQLDREGLNYVVDEKLTFDDQVCLRAGNGTSFIFVGRGDDKDIHSIQVSTTAPTLRDTLRE